MLKDKQIQYLKEKVAKLQDKTHLKEAVLKNILYDEND